MSDIRETLEKAKEIADTKLHASDYQRYIILRESITAALTQLSALERDREAKDQAYAERNRCVIALAALANRLGWKVGVARHTGIDWEDDWRDIVYIDTPSGQVSWHFHDSEKMLIEWIPPYDGDWDGHTTDEKYERLAILGTQEGDDG